jgi:hypothetical protein
MKHFVNWLLGRKPTDAMTPDPLSKPPKKKSSAIYRLDQGVARNQIDREKNKQRPTDDLGDQER